MALDQIQEAISSVQFPKASLLIKLYLRKHLKRPVFLFPEPEHVKTVHGLRVGIRYFIGRIESVRLNWLADGKIDSSKNLLSVDYYDGSRFDGKPTMHMEFDKAQSLVKSLPMIVSFIQNPIMGDTLWYEENAMMESVLANMSSNFASINEAAPKSGNIYPTIINVIRALGEGLQLKDMRNDPALGIGYDAVVKTIRAMYPNFFEKKGVIIQFSSQHNAKKMSAPAVAQTMGLVDAIGATVTNGTAETIIASKEIEAMEDALPRLAFEEQLGDLRRAMVLLMNNATNSLWLAGRGGIGKTVTVEEELKKRGLTDGTGYFKITGSASTAGIYRILYQHRKDILLFDDSDGALADMDSRNLFKAASDTKKVRKISWMKAGKSYVDPDDMEDDGDDNPDILPRYFDFHGKIIFISNLKLDKLDPDGALRTRGFVINIDPTDEEVYKYMAKIVGHIHLDVDYELTDAQRQSVIDILRTRKLKEGGVNLRQLVRGLNTMAGILKDGGHDWQNMVLRYA